MASPVIERVDVRVCRLPTVPPRESDGTATWSETTMVIAEVRAGSATGLGYSYVTGAAAQVIRDVLEPCVRGCDALAIPELAARMATAVRNHGRGYQRIKIKIGRTPAEDLDRVRALAEAAGPSIELMVDANGAYAPKQAAVFATRAAHHGVVYFEEPVSSDDLEGLRFVRAHSPAAVAAGEYGYDPIALRRLLEAAAVDILQADATRCLGISGFMQADALCDAFERPLSAHCAPAIHVHAGAAARRLVHVEHFRDHVRMENELFEGTPVLDHGDLVVDLARPGLGLALREQSARRLAA